MPGVVRVLAINGIYVQHILPQLNEVLGISWGELNHILRSTTYTTARVQSCCQLTLEKDWVHGTWQFVKETIGSVPSASIIWKRLEHRSSDTRMLRVLVVGSEGIKARRIAAECFVFSHWISMCATDSDGVDGTHTLSRSG